MTRTSLRVAAICAATCLCARLVRGAKPQSAIASPSPKPECATIDSQGRWVESSLWGYPATKEPTPASPPRLLVYLPRGYCGEDHGPWPLAIGLHGWAHHPEDWRDRTGVAALADSHGVVLAFPDMGKTVYETAFFPESHDVWGPLPGARWVVEVVLPYMRQHFLVCTEKRLTAILGYSTGGRGAVVAAGRCDEFAFCGSLSGTYDLDGLSSTTGEYRIHAYVFGERAAFPNRWHQQSCMVPEYRERLRALRLYLAHGDADTVASASQARAMQAFLGPGAQQLTIDIVPGAGHDWTFWNSELPKLFRALGETLSNPRVNAREELRTNR